MLPTSFRRTSTNQRNLYAPDPFSPRRRSAGASLVNALLATALFRCWHILLFFTGWATLVVLVSRHIKSLAINPVLLTVIGTVLGFVISYRTTSSFERYNEGRRLWAQIILHDRTFARLVWFHVPESMPLGDADKDLTDDLRKARVLIEKKTVINLLEAFSVAVKHYLRGEDGIYYTDLYYLVKYLPAYPLPAGMPSSPNNQQPFPLDGAVTEEKEKSSRFASSTSLQQGLQGLAQRPLAGTTSMSAPHLPLSSLPAGPPRAAFLPPQVQTQTPHTPMSATRASHRDPRGSLAPGDDGFLLPAHDPPKWYILDLFPFSLITKALAKRGRDLKGRTAAKVRAKRRGHEISHNLPLEISLYLSSYVAALQFRKAIDPPTATSLLNSLTALIDALTGLERILTTPIPFSYHVHLWVVTIIYCLALPLQVWATLKWLTIPATTIASFIFFGFLVAGEEIENPFGYDKNDLNMDHFTNNIIRTELRAITATPAPSLSTWVFSPENDLVFAHLDKPEEEKVTPQQWLDRGLGAIGGVLSRGGGV